MAPNLVLGRGEIELRASLKKLEADLKKAKDLVSKAGADMAKSWDIAAKSMEKSSGRMSDAIDKANTKNRRTSKTTSTAVATDWMQGFRVVEAAVGRLEKNMVRNFTAIRRQGAAEARAMGRAWAISLNEMNAGFASLRSRTSRPFPMPTPGGGGGGEGGGGALVTGASMLRMVPGAGPVAAGVAALYTLKQISDGADRWTVMSNKIAAAGIPLSMVQDRLDDVADAANRSRAPLDETVSLYARLAATAKEAGYSHEEILRVVETFQKTLTASGATTAEAASATVQFSQAMGSGVLRGEEFNAIMENAQPIARAIAKEFGVTTGELRTMAEQGELSSERVMRAILAFGAQADETFNKTKVSAASAGIVLENSMVQLAGEINKTIPIADAYAASLMGIAGGASAAAIALEKMRAGRPEDDPYYGLGLVMAGVSPEQAAAQRAQKDASFAKSTTAARDAIWSLFGGRPREKQRMSGEGDVKGLVAGVAADFKVAQQEAKAAEREADRLAKAAERVAEAFAKLETARRNWRSDPTIKGEDREALERASDAVSGRLTSGMAPSLDKASDAAQARQDRVNEWKSDIREAFATGDWAEIFGARLQDRAADALSKAFDKAIDVLANLLEDVLGGIGGSGGGVGGFIASLFGGGNALSKATGWGGGWFRASGGPVSAGSPYIVGERGPEMFMPSASGSIVPANITSSMMRGGRGSPTYIFNAPGADAAALERLRQTVMQMDHTFDGRAVGAAYRAQQRDIIE